MSIMYDFHMHSSFSTDSDTPAEDMVTRSMELRLKGICFTEHMDLDYPGFYHPSLPSAFAADPDAVLQKISLLRTLPRVQEAGFSVGFGLEFGMQPHLGGVFDELARRLPLDFIIASQHLVSGKDPYYPDAWEGSGPEVMIRSYYEEMLQNLKVMDQWDTLGHPDYIIRYIPDRGNVVFDSYRAFPELIDAILLEVIRRDRCLEVNTAGYKHWLGQPNPSPSILRRYRELGGTRITIGADAHVPEQIAFAYDKVRDLLLSLGYHYYTVFRSRIPEDIPL